MYIDHQLCDLYHAKWRSESFNSVCKLIQGWPEFSHKFLKVNNIFGSSVEQNNEIKMKKL